MSASSPKPRWGDQLSIDPARFPLFDKLLFAVFVLAVPVAMASSSSVFRDGDVSWHVAAGRWILEHSRVPNVDPFSFSKSGEPWIAFEWLAEIIYAAGYNLAGHAGLAAVVALALMGVYGFVFVRLRPRIGPIGILGAFAAMNLVLFPFILARPHVIAWPLLAAWTAVLLNRRERGQAPPLALALLMFVWANVHGSFFIGFIIAGAFALDALIAAGWSRNMLTKWLVFGIAALVAALLNANGFAGFLHPLTISGMKTLPFIGEWQASSPRSTPLFYLVVLGGLGIVLWKRPSFTVGELLLLLVTLALAFVHIRHQAVFMIVAALIVPARLSSGARDSSAPLFRSLRERRAWIGAAMAATLVILVGRAMIPLTPPDSFSNPRGLIAHVPAPLRTQAVFNDYSMGGPLILAGIRTYIDGRADMYGDEFFKGYLDIVDGDLGKFDQAVRRYDIRWAILQKDARLAKKLDARPDWARFYSDDVGVIYVRRVPAGAPPPRG